MHSYFKINIPIRAAVLSQILTSLRANPKQIFPLEIIVVDGYVFDSLKNHLDVDYTDKYWSQVPRAQGDLFKLFVVTDQQSNKHPYY